MLLLLVVASISCSGGCYSEPWEENLPGAHPRFSPQWTGDGRIVFPGATNYGGEIYIAAADGSSLRRISANKGKVEKIDYAPDVSPAGDRIVYATSRHKERETPRNFEIETAGLDGKGRKRLSENVSYDLSPRWSPDGESIAFMKRSHWEEEGVYLMDAAGGNLRLVFPFISRPPGDWAYYDDRTGLAWSPSGDPMALVLRDRNLGRRDTLLVVDTNDYLPRQVFAAPAQDVDMETYIRQDSIGMIYGEPAWSPDGERLAFLYYRYPHQKYPPSEGGPDHAGGFPDQRPGWRLALVDLSDMSLSAIDLDPESDWNSPCLSWSPDGKEILLTMYKKGSAYHSWYFGGLLDLRFIYPESPEERHIVAAKVETGYVRVVHEGAYASWSPDGSRIAILGKVDDTGGHLATVAPDGSDLRILVRVKDSGDLSDLRSRDNGDLELAK